MSEPLIKRKSTQRILGKLGWVFVGAIVATAVPTIYDAATKDDPPSAISAQIDKIRSDLAHNSRVVISAKPYDLHGSGQRSYLIVSRDSQYGNPSQHADHKLIADRVEIYDNAAGVLKRRFSFQPRLNEDFNDAPLFGESSVHDLGGDGRSEVIGAFYSGMNGGSLPRPVAIAWDERRRKYRLNALIAHRPRIFPAHYLHRAASKEVQALYAHPVELRDVTSDQRVKSYITEFFGIRRHNGFTTLVAAFGARGASHLSTSAYELTGWLISLHGSRVSTGQCLDPPGSSRSRPIIARIPQHQTTPPTRHFVAQWAKNRASVYC